jgi:hypothetical protein
MVGHPSRRLAMSQTEYIIRIISEHNEYIDPYSVSNELHFEHIEYLTKDDAKAMAMWRGDDLSIDGLETLSIKTADALSHWN